MLRVGRQTWMDAAPTWMAAPATWLAVPPSLMAEHQAWKVGHQSMTAGTPFFAVDKTQRNWEKANLEFVAHNDFNFTK